MEKYEKKLEERLKYFIKPKESKKSYEICKGCIHEKHECNVDSCPFVIKEKNKGKE